MNNYLLLSYGLTILILLYFFLGYEKSRPKARDLMPIVVVCTAASVGRAIFAFIPQVQPVTALVIIMGCCFGKRIGFITGALCAVISNIFLGQGPWTLFQMLAWGTVGFLSGCWPVRMPQKEPQKKNRLHLAVLCIWAFLSALLFSIITDVWTISTLGPNMNVQIALGVFLTGMAFNTGHAIGNVLFLMLFYPGLSRMFLRLRTKYGIFS